MSELAHRVIDEPAPINHIAAVAELATWAESARAAHDVAVQLCQTSFVPESFRDKPHEATAAILSGLEVGLSPMAALRSYDVIHGTAAPRAATLRAIVQSRGHEVWVHEATNTRAIVRGRRRGSTQVEESTWTMDRAKQLGLAGKDNWRKQPIAMLTARATSELCRLIASDAILGIAYTVEELIDDEMEASVVPPEANTTTKKKRTARRAQIEPPASPPPAEPEFDEPAPQTDTGAFGPPDSPSAPVSPALINDAQMKKMHADFNEVGITDRDERLAYTVAVIDRDIATSKELTLDEASRVIDALERAIADLKEGGGEWTEGSS